MSYHRWLKNLRSTFHSLCQAPRGAGRAGHVERDGTIRRRRGSLQGSAPRPTLECLEERCLLSFSPAVSYPAGTFPQAALTADFNDDGQLDLATVNVGDNTVSVLLGNADGTFQQAQNSATGAGPASLAEGDFDRDGRLDLATANPGGGDVSVLLGNGDGTFQAPTNIAIGSSPQSIAVGDFDADGMLDLGVTSNTYYSGYCYYYGCYPGYFAGRVNVLLGNGTGSFSGPTTTDLGNGFYSGAAVADFDNDLKQDFAAASNDGFVNVLLGNGDGTFTSWTSCGTGYYPVSVSAEDVNDDGNPDLVTSNSNDISVMLGDGLGTFGATQNYSAGSNPRSVVVADFNGDGMPDLATADLGSDTVSVLLGAGGGSFRPPVNVVTGSGPSGLAVGDFNGDHRPDVASANSSSGDVAVLINDGTWPALDAPFITVDDVTVTEGNAGTVSAVFTVTLSAGYGQPVTVHYVTEDGSASASGGDYQADSGMVTIAVGETTTSITILVNGDRIAEYPEFFLVRLTDPTNAFIADSTGEATIADDEPTVSLAANMSSVEGNTATTAMSFTVTLSAAYDAPVSVDYATANFAGYDESWYGTGARAGVDYTATLGTLIIDAGQTLGTITVPIIGDRVAEPTESFWINLTNSASAHIGSNRAMGSITDDEPRISISDVTKVEGRKGQKTLFGFEVTLSVAYDQPVTVSFETVDGTARKGEDYTARTGTLTFLPGETRMYVTIEVKGDNKREGNETFFVDLFGNSPNISAFTKRRGIGTILNDD